MAEKAESLLNKDTAILQAPGSADGTSFMVENTTMVRPHHVTKAKNSKTTLAIAQIGRHTSYVLIRWLSVKKTKTTLNYLQWFKRNGPNRVNLANFITCDSSKGVGKKGAKSSTARRKGGRPDKTAPTTIVDRLSGYPTTCQHRRPFHRWKIKIQQLAKICKAELKRMCYNHHCRQ